MRHTPGPPSHHFLSLARPSKTSLSPLSRHCRKTYPHTGHPQHRLSPTHFRLPALVTINARVATVTMIVSHLLIHRLYLIPLRQGHSLLPIKALPTMQLLSPIQVPPFTKRHLKNGVSRPLILNCQARPHHP